MFTSFDYVLGSNCVKALWLTKHEGARYKRNNIEDSEGILVKEIARQLFPSGVAVGIGEVNEMCQQTAILVSTKTTIYNGCFVWEDFLIRPDVLSYNNGSYELYLIKNTTSARDKQGNIDQAYFNTLSMQVYVLEKLGYGISVVGTIYLNNQYIRGDTLNVQELFIIDDMTKEIQGNYKLVENKWAELKKVLQGEEPLQSIGQYCNQPYDCMCKDYCWKDVPYPSVFDLNGTHVKMGKKFEMYKSGYISFPDILTYPKLNKNAKLQIECEVNNTTIINKDAIRKELASWHYPLYFLDFESFMQAIPQYKGLKPYQQIPFQYSLHIMKEHSTALEHREFIAEPGVNPLRDFAESLISDITEKGSVVVYNKGFEQSRIKELMVIFPDLAEELERISNQIVDLMVVFKERYYYVKQMKGKYSIKYVLPALYPENDELNYKKLNIQNGDMAMKAFAYLHMREKKERDQVIEDLLKYCCLDTLAMVRIWEKLKELIA